MTDSEESPSEDLSYPSNIRSLKITHEEARTVLDHQISILNDIDNKATRTVRITAVILGIIVSAPSVIENPNTFVNPFTKWGIAGLVLSISLGMFTYSSSSPDLGPNSSDINRMLDNKYRDDEWLVILLDSYEDWIDRTQQVNQFNGIFLALSQLSLITSLSLLAWGVKKGMQIEFSVFGFSTASLPILTIFALSVVYLLYISGCKICREYN
ncbi:hypothetical protein EGH21_12575 [Halomicroarcula sp. F13]|uniref:Uncharacterized protein n=1 Tax=Haloarcula rubra TaxID=2487747 RepID=A0AAW4PTJ6_9EURY|nr:hypothetical protein [Halomicroarcula rubra]MBX0323865.1 hypothetical protein [Halomicroarcula rubra]